jgi:opacity protein-like surface antigen
MKKLLLAAAILGISGTAFAADNGFYLGAQAGWANTGDTISFNNSTLANSYDTFTSTNRNNVFAGGAFLGYQFSPFVAAQLGYTKLSNAKSSYTGTDNDPIFGQSTDHASATLKTQIVDLVGKVMFPIQCSGVGLYAKAGAAYVDETVNVNVTSSDAFGNSVSGSGSDSTHPIRPEVGAGISFDFSPNLVGDVGYTYIDGNNKIDHINAVAASIAYHFA